MVPPGSVVGFVLALVPASWAHLPHATTPLLLPPPSLDPSLPWLAIVDARPAVLVRSDDGGRDWTMLAVPPAGDGIRTAARRDDGRLFVASARLLWWTDDFSTWFRVPLPVPTTALAVSGDELYLAADDGIYAFDGAAITGPVLRRRALSVVEGPRLTALLADGSVARLDDGGWVVFEAPEGVSAVVDVGSATVVGTRGGEAWRRDGDAWTACGELPIAGGAHRDVVALASDGTTLALATGEYAAFTSTDACASWFDQAAPHAMLYGPGDGLLSDPAEAVQSLHVSGDRLAWSGFDGIWTLPGGGEAWREASVLGADYTRGGAWLPGTGAPALVLGFYAAGPSRTDDAGDTWNAGNLGLVDTNAQFVVADPSTGGLLAVVGHANWMSADGGASWTALPGHLDMESFVGIDPTTPGRALAAGVDGGAWESLDGGLSWAPVPDELGGGVASAHAVVPGRFECLGVVGPAALYCRPLGAAAWSLVATFDTADEVRLAANERALYVSHGATLSRLDDPAAALATVLELEADQVRVLASADDGTILAATLAGDLWVIGMEGNDAERHAGAIPAPPWVLLPVPGFGETREVVVPTLDGTYLWRERDGASLPLFPVERVDLASPFWHLAGCPEEVATEGAHMGMALPISRACLATVLLHGERVLFYGTSTGTGRVTVSVDGEEVATLGESASTGIATLLDLQVTPGLHELALAGLEEGVVLDVVEGRDEGTPWTPPTGDTGEDTAALSPARDSSAEAACGCGGQGATFLVAVPWWRRRPGRRAQKLTASTAHSPSR